MRFDQSMRVLKQLLDRGELGEPVLATIEMRAIPHWQPFLRDYDRLTLLNMCIHHLDVLRFLFGDPAAIFTIARPDPRTAFAHSDGITVSTLQFPGGLIAVSMEDVWTGPAREGGGSDIYIKWRVEGTEGLAQGTIGWPDYPEGSPSTLRYASTATKGEWVEPRWETTWFPHAFSGVMEQLQYALEQRRDARARRAPTTSRPWPWSRPAIARWRRTGRSSSPSSASETINRPGRTTS